MQSSAMPPGHGSTLGDGRMEGRMSQSLTQELGIVQVRIELSFRQRSLPGEGKFRGERRSQGWAGGGRSIYEGQI
jgi:hypothetical protein